MRSTYKYLALAICLLVIAQAAFIVYANAAMRQWIDDDGGILDKATDDFPGLGGFIAHGMSGTALIPLVALALLVVGLLTKVRSAAIHGAVVFGLVVLQVILGMTAHSVPALGPLHGINAFLIFGAALHASRLMADSAEPAKATQLQA